MLICKGCGKEIITLRDYHTKGQCRECRNKYMRQYYQDNFKIEVRKRVQNGRMYIETDGGYKF